tara:strand:- start:49 stop:567 length:519 start_codon:yes stop_codon:yes gene_type:complete
MSLIRIIILSIILIFGHLQIAFADDSNEKNIVESAKEINQEIKNKQSATEANINSEVLQELQEEELPLNDPFAGGASDSSVSNELLLSSSDDDNEELSLYHFKLVGIISGSYQSYITLVNSSGDPLTLELNESLNEDLRLVDLKLDEAIFKKADDMYISIDFNNQIKEIDEY